MFFKTLVDFKFSRKFYEITIEIFQKFVLIVSKFLLNYFQNIPFIVIKYSEIF